MNRNECEQFLGLTLGLKNSFFENIVYTNVLRTVLDVVFHQEFDGINENS